MRHRSLIAISAVTVVAATSFTLTSTSTSAAPTSGQAATASDTSQAGSFALSGEAARGYRVPADLRELWRATLPDGRTQTRYQQVAAGATVFGGQVTVLRTPAGAVDSVVGAYFPGLRPVTTKKLDKQAARAAVEKQVGARGKWSNTLRLDPRTGVLFFEVQSQRDASRPVRWVNAGTGRTIKAFDAIAEGEGTGVKGDTKPLLTTRNTAAKTYELRSPDARQVTYTADNGTSSATLMTDSNDIWNFNIPSLMGKSQAPGVDAHYYANVVDDFYRDTFGRDSIDGQGMPIVSVVHWDKAYCNAFWNGAYMTYGDGDGPTCLPLSGGLDVDGHELTHGVTEYTSNLIYENESGALNEGFSDMMGNTIEFYAAKKNLDPAAKPDFRIGEDVINTQTPATAGFRNMGDPGEFGDPDHVVDKYTGEEDGGGVHTNSGIANHAYYLTVQGGQNAGCRATTQRAATHTEDCKVKVPALGLDRAAQVYYAGFSSLPEFANFCDARNATTAVAGARDAKSVGLAWDAVGVHKGCAGGTPPPPPCTSNPNASFPIESPHPYGNNGDCTWTYNGAAGGYRLHFTSFDLEADFDYLYVRDGGGATVATYTGQLGAFDSPCITTPASSVRLVTDPAVTGQGFVISGTVPC